MAEEPTRYATRTGCWVPLIVFLDVLFAVPFVLWVFDKLGLPWNVLVLGVMLFPLPFYFFDARRKKRLARKR